MAKRKSKSAAIGEAVDRLADATPYGHAMKCLGPTMLLDAAASRIRELEETVKWVSGCSDASARSYVRCRHPELLTDDGRCAT